MSMLLPAAPTELVLSIHTALASQGYAYLPVFSSIPTGQPLVLARSLGPLYLPPNVDPAHPLLETLPSADASPLAPFDGSRSSHGTKRS
jgi:hypothetical protein